MLVRAKRAGWDQPEGKYTETDYQEPPSWMDDQSPVEVEGELVREQVSATEHTDAYERVTVAGVEVDPGSIEELSEEVPEAQMQKTEQQVFEEMKKQLEQAAEKESTNGS